MRIAHVSDCYLPRTGGIELQVRGLSQAQHAAGEQPRIFTATPARKGEPVIPGETDEGVPVYRMAVNLPAQLPVSPTVGKKLAAAIQAEADVVHIHGGLVSPFAWPALRTCVKAGMPVVVSVHSVWNNWSRAFGAMNVFTKWREWPIIWTTVSEMAADSLRSAIGPNADVRILANGIDVSSWHNHLEPPRAHNDITAVTVARLAVRKRSGELLRVLMEARKQIPQEIGLRAIFIGDGPDRSKLERVISSNNLDWVQLVGWKDHDEIRALFAESDIYVTATILESFGIAALEARTYGLPVVANGESGMRSFIRDGEEGLLVSDDTDMARAIARLATDSALLEKITQHNRTTEPEYGWPKVIENANQQYRDAMALVGRS